MNDDKKLDELLMKRDIPPPSSNLSYRITEAAKIRQERVAPSWQEELWQLFLMPKPAYATAFCLVFGMAIGLYTGLNDAQAQDWFLFLEASSDIQEEGWL